jgi:F-type H+-transporting ATPase subunit a
MRSAGRFLLSLVLLSAAAGATAGATAGAQEHPPAHGAPAEPRIVGGDSIAAPHGASPAQHQAAGHADMITPHITDSHHIEYPCLNASLACEADLPHWAPVHLPLLGEVDLSPTKHVVMMLVAALLCIVVLVTAAVAHTRHTHAVGRPKGFAAGIEAMVLYLRNEVVLPNVGHHGDAFVPFVLTLFFFILFANVLGLIPYGATATGNISVTATLAIITAIVVELAGIRAQGLGYLNTIFYWNKDLPLAMRIPMFILMSPIEMVGKIARPFALTIRLFANMTAGHIVVLALIGLIFTFGNIASGVPFLAAVAIMLLELFVAFLQAFIFSLLASVFIGQIREGAH